MLESFVPLKRERKNSRNPFERKGKNDEVGVKIS
jgi:hypothetical protein